MGKQLVMYTTLLLSLSIILLPFTCTAFDATENYFDDSSLFEYADEARKEDFHKTSIETKNSFIENFDVSDSGDILICLENQTVNVYDSNGMFRFTIEYDSNSSSSMAFWHGNNIVIYIFREHICVFFNEDGTLAEIYEFGGNSSDLINGVIKKKKITVGNCTYTSEKSNILVSLSSRDNQLTKQNNTTGEIETIYIYKKAGYRMLKFSIGIVLFISVFVLAILYIVNKKKIDKLIIKYS